MVAGTAAALSKVVCHLAMKIMPPHDNCLQLLAQGACLLAPVSTTHTCVRRRMKVAVWRCSSLQYGKASKRGSSATHIPSSTPSA